MTGQHHLDALQLERYVDDSDKLRDGTVARQRDENRPEPMARLNVSLRDVVALDVTGLSSASTALLPPPALGERRQSATCFDPRPIREKPHLQRRRAACVAAF
jgi:hypothetical protein